VLVVQKTSHRPKSNRKDNNTNGRVVVEEEDAVVVVMRVVCCLGKEKVRPQFRRVLLQRIIQHQSSARTADLLLRRRFACATASCPRGNRSSFSARRERCACLSVAR
jgi:hypothetical protein